MQTNSTPAPSRSAFMAIFALVLVGLGVLAFIARSGWMTDAAPRDKAEPADKAAVASTLQLDAATKQQVAAFCGDCHRLPSADQFPRSAWTHEVKRGFQFYQDSRRTDLQPPTVAAAVAYFESQAPESVKLEPIPAALNPCPIRFGHSQFAGGQDPPQIGESTISSINWLKRRPGEPGELVCSDMRLGRVLNVGIGERQLTATQMTAVPHPTVVRVVDLDGDGQTELVVADLGSYQPEDHELGAVWWIRDLGVNGAEPERLPLFSGIGRIADVNALDADGDGDQDLVVAEFGWHKTGGIHILENQGMENGKPKLQPHLIDRRPGTIHVPVADLDGDGRLDFVALISQEHETVIGFLNRGTLKFEAHAFGEAQDPSIGSSGLSLVDLDGDKDIDVLLTCGDTFDSYSIKPAHGVQWLENDGSLKFTRHMIVPMPGAHRALAGDMDGDGDLDIVAAAFLPKKLLDQQRPSDFDSLILLEQTDRGLFEKYRLEGAFAHHMALEMADFDADGDLDLAVGNFSEQKLGGLPPLTIWWNLRIEKPAQ